MTIDKTVDMCRASTTSYVVKAILGAATFEDPKDVIARLTIETSKDNDDKQILAYQKYSKNNNKQNIGNSYKKNNNRGRYNNNYQNNNNGQYNNSNNSYRGRGRGRGRGSYQNNGNNGQYDNRNNYVRFAEASTSNQQIDLGFNDAQHQQSSR